MNEIAQYFDQRADEWDLCTCRTSPVQGAVASIAHIQPGSRVLDLGCGTGIMADVYIERNVREFIALDIAPRMVEIAQQKYCHESRAQFICCDALCYKDLEPFDAVVIYNAYPHFLDKRALAEHISTLLKPHGRFIVAHSMGREQMNLHHANVPQSVKTELPPATEASLIWTPWFDIDSVVDAPGFYCFSGALR